MFAHPKIWLIFSQSHFPKNCSLSLLPLSYRKCDSRGSVGIYESLGPAGMFWIVMGNPQIIPVNSFLLSTCVRALAQLLIYVHSHCNSFHVHINMHGCVLIKIISISY